MEEEATLLNYYELDGPSTISIMAHTPLHPQNLMEWGEIWYTHFAIIRSIFDLDISKNSTKKYGQNVQGLIKLATRILTGIIRSGIPIDRFYQNIGSGVHLLPDM